MTEIIVKILIALLFISGVIFFIITQKNNIKEWLLYAVVEAEKELGSKTGKIKLRQVYNEFIITFPIISKLITFDIFSKLVDIAVSASYETPISLVLETLREAGNVPTILEKAGVSI